MTPVRPGGRRALAAPPEAPGTAPRAHSRAAAPSSRTRRITLAPAPAARQSPPDRFKPLGMTAASLMPVSRRRSARARLPRHELALQIKSVERDAGGREELRIAPAGELPVQAPSPVLVIAGEPGGIDDEGPTLGGEPLVVPLPGMRNHRRQARDPVPEDPLHPLRLGADRVVALAHGSTAQLRGNDLELLRALVPQGRPPYRRAARAGSRCRRARVRSRPTMRAFLSTLTTPWHHFGTTLRWAIRKYLISLRLPRK
jgi:hypothetical protein